MRQKWNIILSLLIGLMWAPQAHGATDILVLSYHDIHDSDPDMSRAAISTDNFVLQIEWMLANNYTPISVREILAARDHGASLPDKPVLLSFDDGYSSFYSKVFPLLRAYNIPAVQALVTSWIETQADEMVSYGDEQVPRSEFLTVPQIKEMADSGLVEIASHSHNMHKGAQGNPQGNIEPTAAILHYSPLTKSYETPEAFRKRISADLGTSVDLIQGYIGKLPAAIVWPFGEYSNVGVEVAASLGVPVTISLDWGYASVSDLGRMKRILVGGDMSLSDFSLVVQRAGKHGPMRAMHVDLDYIYDKKAEQLDRNLDILLDRVKSSGVSHVYLQAFSDLDGDSVAEALYFPNRHLPIRHDLFNRVSWQLRTRAAVSVFAWMPLLAFDVGREDWLVKSWNSSNDAIEVDRAHPERLSPFQAQSRETLIEIFQDLGRSSRFAGILFSDDGILTDFEDASDAGLKSASDYLGRPVSIKSVREDRDLFHKWTDFKVQSLISLSHELLAAASEQSGRLLSARNLFAAPVLEKNAREWYAQDLESSLKAYDFTPIMAMPYLEGIAPSGHQKWFLQLFERVASYAEGIDKTVFEVQAFDWNHAEQISAEEFRTTVRYLQTLGARHLAYYPDDFLRDHPPLSILKREFSRRLYPFALD